ncbi:ANTAR domain-containing protein [Paraburkholderia azotifigens]|uniref:ANTAR domain-containing response regulator n=1 Tax=Paraburkholderia azotifigens TaxID=2057004 RepID=UPI0031773210
MTKAYDHSRSGAQAPRPAQQILKDLHSTRVCVFHPNDSDGKELTRQLQRIGCQTEVFWTVPPALPPDTGLVFVSVSPDMTGQEFPWSACEDAPPVIAVVNYENPTVVNQVFRLGALAIVTSPVHSFGLLSKMAIALETSRELKECRARIARLEGKLIGVRTVATAQNILSSTRGIDLDEAYKLMRARAMSKRVTIEEIASDFVNANAIVAFK